MNLVSTNQVVVLTGETGCGKTTQVPQFILDDAAVSKTPCWIICTQPRRVAATSVAERVAAEWGETIGNTVGYNVRLESKQSQQARQSQILALLDLSRAPYVLYGVKYIDLVSLTARQSQILTSRPFFSKWRKIWI